MIVHELDGEDYLDALRTQGVWWVGRGWQAAGWWGYFHILLNLPIDSLCFGYQRIGRSRV